MRVHYLQHVPFENPGYIGDWARQQGYELSGTALFAGQPLPDMDAFDHLLVMGGPMGVHDETRYEWLTREKHFIEQALSKGKRTLGICLGAQLIADVLGARVYRNAEKEIGWFEVFRPPPALASDAASVPRFLPERFFAFHWHGDTFELPSGALHLARSQACRHQAFYHSPGILALQFHLETTAAGIGALLENCRDELVEAPFIQDAAIIRGQMDRVSSSNRYMAELLDRFFNPAGPGDPA
jgi:GMP synthase-like glutamine amidotransferase